MKASWSPPKIWKNGECYILGGGPSIPEVFDIPESLVRAVRKKEKDLSTFSPYMEPIHDKHVIAVNSAYKLGNWIDVIFFGDKTWYLDNRYNLAKIPRIKVTCSPYFRTAIREEQIKFIARDSKKLGLSDKPTTLCWNYNSGACAIDLAIHFGVKRIYLLGFDMQNKAKTGNSHWHAEYSNRKKDPPYKRHLQGFPSIAKIASQRDIEIINISTNTAITEFPIWRTLA